MRAPSVSLEQSLPVAATHPFLLAAPWFAVAAGVALALAGPGALASRWSPVAAAVTHLLTVGFMLQTMCGALLQFSPVVVGAEIPRARALAAIVQPVLGLGALALAAGLGWTQPRIVEIGAGLLAIGVTVFAAAVGSALWSANGPRSSLYPLRAAIAGLAVTTILGASLALVITGHVAAALVALANLHALWGLLGWALVLLVGVSVTVVPLLQLTAKYPRYLPHALTAGLGAALVVATGAWLLGASGAWVERAFDVALVLGAAFALATLALQMRRRRPGWDAALAFHGLSMVAAVLLAAWRACSARWWPESLADAAPMIAGVLGIVGVFVSVMTGMLYKIVPFTTWLALTRQFGVRGVPSMTRLLPESAARGQLAAHVLALVALLIATVVPTFVRPAGLLLAVSGAWLGINLGRADWSGREARRRLQTQQ